MADQKISQLNNITGANVDDTADELAIVDSSATQTKAITRGELFSDVSKITTDTAGADVAIKALRPANTGTGDPVVIVAGDGDAGDVLLEMRGNTDATLVDTADAKESADAKFIFYGNGASTFNGPLTLNSNATITGDLTVSGTTTTVNTQNLDVKDAVIALNTGQATPLNDIGMLFQRYASATASNYNVVMAWDESVDKLIFGSTAEDGSDNTITFVDEWMTITSGGNVGIGLTNPTVKLDVSGTAAARGNLVVGSDTLSGSSFHVNSTTNITRAQGAVEISNALAGREGYLTLSDGTNATSTPLWTLSVDSTDSDSFYLWDETAGSYPFAVTPGGSNGLFVIDGANDRVGIGTTSPATALDVAGTVTADGLTVEAVSDALITVSDSSSANQKLELKHNGGFSTLLSGNNGAYGRFSIDQFNGTTTRQSFYINDSNDISFYEDTGTTPKFFWDASAESLGIGTSSPRDLLNIFNGTGQIGARFQNTATGQTSGDGSFVGLGISGGSTNGLNLWSYDAVDMVFGTANSERLRIDSSGNVGVGLTNPTVRLDVSGTVAARGNLVAGSDTLVGSKFHVNSTTGVTRAQGAVQISNALAGREGFLTLADGNNAASTDLWTLSVDSTATNSFYMWDDVNSRYHFAVKPGTATSGTLVVDGSNGRVGIGTTSPSQDLHIVDSDPVLRLQDSDGTNQFADFQVVGGDLRFNARNGTSNGEIRFRGYDGTTTTEYASFASSGNFGIGTTSPSAKLDVVGTAEFNDVVYISSRIIHIGDTDTFMQFDAADQWNVVTGNAKRLQATNSEVTILNATDFNVDSGTLFVDASTNRVGIRNTSPNAPLHVTGPTRIQNDFTGREGFLEMYSGTGAGTARWTLSIDSTDSNAFYLWDEQNSSYPFAVKPGGNSGTLVVDGSTDRVGIGTSSPSSTLDVVGNSELNGDLNVDSGTLFVDASENIVGIGTASPPTNFWTGGGAIFTTLGYIGSNGAYALSMYSNGYRNTAGGFTYLDANGNTNTASGIDLLPNGEIKFSTGTASGTALPTRMTINSGGSVGIGTTSPSAKLDVNGAIKSQSFVTTGQGIDITRGDGAAFAVRIENPSGTAFAYNADGGHIFKNRDETVTHGSFTSSAVKFPAAFSATSALAANVRVQTDGQLVRSTSSLKYKHNVEDADLALSEAVVYGSRPVWYQSLSDLDNDAWGFWGFIAEELHEVDPRLVDYAEDENGDLTPDGVQYDRFVVHLVNVAQQQKARIDDLESRLAALEANI